MCDTNRCLVCGHPSDDNWCDDVCFKLRNPNQSIRSYVRAGEKTQTQKDLNHYKEVIFKRETRYAIEPEIVCSISDTQSTISNTAGKYRCIDLDQSAKYNPMITTYCIKAEAI